MSGSFDTTIEQLKGLDRSRNYSELAERLRRLPPNLTQSDRALVAYWQGKLAILGGDPLKRKGRDERMREAAELA